MLQTNQANTHTQQINQQLWHNMIRKDYAIDGCMLELSPEQVAKLLQSPSHQQLNSILSNQQKEVIQSCLAKSPIKALFPKINGRTPKDIPTISKQIRKISDLMQILHSSEYILEAIHEGHKACIFLRHFMKQIAQGIKTYEVFVRGGFVVAIGQKFCDHVEPQIEESTILKLIEVAQEIMPAITLFSPKETQHQLNSFVVSIYHRDGTTKITSIYAYPPYPTQLKSIFKEVEVEQYYREANEENKHRSGEEKYALNEGVVPLVRSVQKQSDLQHYDMGEYLMGNQIDNEQKMQEWKQFMKEAKEKIEGD